MCVCILAVLGLHCCMQVFSTFSAWTSHFSGFSCCRAQALGQTGFSSCGVWTPYLWHINLVAQWHVESSQTRVELMAPAWHGNP